MAGKKNSHSYFLRRKGSTRAFPSPSSTGRPLPQKVHDTLAREPLGNDRVHAHHDFLCRQLAYVLIPETTSTPLVPRSMGTRLEGINIEERRACAESDPSGIMRTPGAPHVLGMHQPTGDVSGSHMSSPSEVCETQNILKICCKNKSILADFIIIKSAKIYKK